MKQYEEAMKDPKIQEQTQQLSQVMQSPEMMQKMAALRVGSETSIAPSMLSANEQQYSDL